MPDESIAAAQEQAVEQVMSDERLLGTLPDDLSQILLDQVIVWLNQAATTASTVDDFWSRADAIRHEARAIADASAEAGDDAPALLARLRSAQPVGAKAPVPDRRVAGSATLRPPLTESLRSSFQRAYDRFRALLRGGVR